MKQEISNSKPVITRIENKRRELELMKTQIGQQQAPLDILAELYSLTPKEILLNMFLAETGKHLTLRGNAPELSGVFNYITTLEKSPFLESVTMRYVTKRDIGEKKVVDFELTARLSTVTLSGSEK
jgi:Tfp pilus assembly protein PilN